LDEELRRKEKGKGKGKAKDPRDVSAGQGQIGFEQTRVDRGPGRLTPGGSGRREWVIPVEYVFPPIFFLWCGRKLMG
jgi:hypothetical protein